MTGYRVILWQGHIVRNMRPAGKAGTKHRRLYTPCGYFCVSSLDTHAGTSDKVTCQKCLDLTERLK